MLILVINCGSSSAKYQLYDVRKLKSLARGIVERIGQANASLTSHNDSRALPAKKVACSDHYAAIEIIVSALTDKRTGVISSWRDIAGIGHRVVHGGEEFKSSVLITDRVIRYIADYSAIAPLHNPPSLSGIRACSEILKGIPQVAVFDTAFHQTMPAHSYLYGIPLKFYRKYGIRRYGFHGTSHRFVSAEAARLLKKPLNRLRLITCHLGNGCSMTAVDRGISVDTTMGFTPLEGLLMGTRSGDIDPSVALYLIEKENMSLQQMSDILNKESGFLGISGISNDMRDLLKAAKSKGGAAAKARLAIDMFAYRIRKYIGAYQAAMGGLDAVVFTGGIGENSPWLIKRIGNELKSVMRKGIRFMTVPTNEELLIAKDTYEIIRGNDAES